MELDVLSVIISGALLVLLSLMSKHSRLTNDVMLYKSKTLVDQALKWCDDKNNKSIRSLRECIYASAYLHSARLISSDSDLAHVTGLDIQALWKRIEDNESKLLKRLTKDIKLKKSILTNTPSWR